MTAEPALTPATFASWGATLVEPLFSTAVRMEVEQAVLREATASPELFIAWTAGILADLAGSLPSDDPWRGLSARLARVVRGDRVGLDEGAWLNGVRFGVPEDAEEFADCAEPQTWESKWGPLAVGQLARGESPFALQRAGERIALSRISAALVGLAFDGRAPLEVAFANFWGAQSDEADQSGERLFAIVEPALRWLVFRRRSYIGAHDITLVEAMGEWTARVAPQERDNSPLLKLVDGKQ